MIVYQLLTDGALNFTHISKVAPFFERSLRAKDSLDDLASPRIFKTHLQCRRVMSYPARYIYVVRDGRDVLVSYFYFYSTYINPRVQFDEFFENFLTGSLQYGSWFKNVAEWNSHRGNENLLFLRYEEIIGDMDEAISVVSKFLGTLHSPDRLQIIRQQCAFSFMQSLEEKFAPQVSSGEIPGEHQGKFIRKGRVGDWKAHFNERQEHAFCEAVADWQLQEFLSTT
jgi:hypothetical protein